MSPPHFDVGGAYLAILRGQPIHPPDAEVFPLVALSVEDLDAAVERLKLRKVELVQEIEEDSTSRWVLLRDPGGNLIELAYWK
jgi:predicted enzyme related to lactoylglutathione lyase